MQEEGVIEMVHPTTGEPRFQAIARIKGNYALLGFYSTYEQAMKAYKKATEQS